MPDSLKYQEANGSLKACFHVLLVAEMETMNFLDRSHLLPLTVRDQFGIIATMAFFTVPAPVFR